MKATITTEFIRRYEKTPPAATIDVYDAKQPRLVLRLRPNGKHAYRVSLGRGKWFTLGSPKTIPTPQLARKQAQKQLGAVADGKDPIAAKKKARAQTFGVYLAKVYRPWLEQHRKTGAQTADCLAAVFADLQALPLDGLTSWRLERWRRDRLAAGITPATTNRNLTYLKAMLRRAVDWGHLVEHPLRKVKKLEEDTVGVLRFLSPEEAQRLRHALILRDDVRREARDSANAWRVQRAYDPMPVFRRYTDHVTPLVLLALNTGLRFGELTGLQWRDVALTRQMLTVRSAHAKSGLARHVPLNTEALEVLASWRPAPCDGNAYVFPGLDGARLVDVKTAWARLLTDAKITGFRFHDLRHTFASNLVMRGVDLNTVRELLGHADIKMTLRYAHLAPEHKAAAVARLVAV